MPLIEAAVTKVKVKRVVDGPDALFMVGYGLLFAGAWLSLGLGVALMVGGVILMGVSLLAVLGAPVGVSAETDGN